MSIFKGIKVIDCTNNVAGPLSTAIMSDYGAEIIKIEKPKYGDDSRQFVPFIENKSITFMWLNRGKKSIVLDMKKPEAVEVIKKLISDADVVVESFRPGVMARYGLDYENLSKINPKLVMCSVSAFGQTGPYSNLPGYDIIAQSLSGMMDLTGEKYGPPIKIGPSVADYTAGFNAFGAISAALFHRERTGEGQHVDVSLLDCLVTGNDYVESAFLGLPSTRQGNHHGLVAPYGVFQSKNGNIVIGVVNTKLWKIFCNLIERPDLIDDPRYNTTYKRVENLEDIIVVIESWLDQFDSIDDVQKLLMETGIPCAKVNATKDLLNDPQLLARKTITDMTVRNLSVDKVKSRGMHLKFSKTKGHMGLAPELGEHQKEVLYHLGYSEEEIVNLQNKGVY